MANAKSVNWGIKEIIPDSSKSIDRANRAVGPFSYQEVKGIKYRHWLGTDSLGRDVLAGVINGSYIALIVGTATLIISLIIGLILAYLSGYYGDTEYKIEKRYLFFLIPTTVLAIFYMMYLSWHWSIIMIPLLILFWAQAKRMSRIDNAVTIAVPLDMIIFRVIDIFNSIPGMFIILVLLAIFNKASVVNVVFVIALLKWPIVTRHLRAEILKIKEEDFIYSAKAIGLSDVKT